MDLENFVRTASPKDIQNFADEFEVVALDSRLADCMNTITISWIHARNLDSDVNGNCLQCGNLLDSRHKIEILSKFIEEVKVWHRNLSDYCSEAILALDDLGVEDISFDIEHISCK